jgi:hypothetical protein
MRHRLRHRRMRDCSENSAPKQKRGRAAYGGDAASARRQNAAGRRVYFFLKEWVESFFPFIQAEIAHPIRYIHALARIA